MPDVEPRSPRPDNPAEPPLAQLRRLAADLSAVEPLVAGIESLLDQLPIESQGAEVELRRFLAIVDIGRLLFAQRTAEVIAHYEAADAHGVAGAARGALGHGEHVGPWRGRPEHITAAELAVYGLPRDAVGVAWSSFEECDMHAIDHAPGRVGVQPAARGVLLYDADDLNCSDCPAGR